MKKILLCMLLAAPCCSPAQTRDTPLSLWAFPGTNWKYASHNSLYAQAGYNPLLHMDALYVQAFLKMSP